MTDLIDTAVLLVAGVGTRLRPLTDEVPKSLVKVGKSSVLELAVAALQDHGVRHFVFATGYRQEAIRSAVLALGIDAVFCHNPRYEETQNSISLLYCRPELAQVGFYKLDGDVLFDPEILGRLQHRKEQLVVAVDGVHPLDAEAMKVVVDSERRILRLGKPIAPTQAQGESIGIERVTASMTAPLFDAIEALDCQGNVGRYYEEVYSDLIDAQTITACAVEVGDLRWTEIDDYADLQRAEAMFG